MAPLRRAHPRRPPPLTPPPPVAAARCHRGRRHLRSQRQPADPVRPRTRGAAEVRRCRGCRTGGRERPESVGGREGSCSRARRRRRRLPSSTAAGVRPTRSAHRYRCHGQNPACPSRRGLGTRVADTVVISSICVGHRVPSPRCANERLSTAPNSSPTKSPTTIERHATTDTPGALIRDASGAGPNGVGAPPSPEGCLGVPQRGSVEETFPAVDEDDAKGGVPGQDVAEDELGGGQGGLGGVAEEVGEAEGGEPGVRRGTGVQEQGAGVPVEGGPQRGEAVVGE